MQVAAALTPSTASHVAAAIIAAYNDVRGTKPPVKSSWLWPLALSANETDQWRAMWNWNVGNVTTSSDSVAWFYNPHVTAGLKFRSFDGILPGAVAMLKTLDRHGGIVAADAGDQVAWQSALDGYLGGGTYPSLKTLIARLDSVQPEGGNENIAPPATSSRRPVITLASGVGLVALTAAATFGAKSVLKLLPHRRHA